MQRWDIHCHILPGVDDGANTPEQTKRMLLAAKAAGITGVIATPHIKTMQPDMDRISACFAGVKHLFIQQGIALRLGYEFDSRLLWESPGMRLQPFCIEGTGTVLLELSRGYLPLQWENGLRRIQGQGLDIIIAHPERCQPIQEDVGIAVRMAEIGCELQLSANAIDCTLLSKERRCQAALLRQGLISYIASDAHTAGDYRAYAQAQKRWGAWVKPGELLQKV